MPQLTTPTWIQVPLILHIRGPPESPCGKGTVTEHVRGQGAQPQQARARRRPPGQDWPQHLTMQGPRPREPAHSMSSGMIFLLSLCRYFP